MIVVVWGFQTHNQLPTCLYRGLHEKTSWWDKQFLYNIVAWFVDEGYEITVVYNEGDSTYDDEI